MSGVVDTACNESAAAGCIALVGTQVAPALCFGIHCCGLLSKLRDLQRLYRTAAPPTAGAHHA
jgi:hypothetical protein